ncbi:MAG: hypothetical protein ABEJ03_00335 [Candidatus Nanohaloarchaea archaeon]
MAFLSERFGIDMEEVESLEIEKRSGDYWLVSEDDGKDLDVEVSGVRLLRTGKLGLKPTTYALQLLEQHISRNVVEVSGDEFQKLLAREEMIERELQEEGYVAIEYEGRIFGCGYYRDGVVSSRVPKGRSKELLGALSL